VDEFDQAEGGGEGDDGYEVFGRSFRIAGRRA